MLTLGVVNIVRKARQYLKKDVHLPMGGFHLMGVDTSQIRERIQALRALGVKKAAPSHCMGEAAIACFYQINLQVKQIGGEGKNIFSTSSSSS